MNTELLILLIFVCALLVVLVMSLYTFSNVSKYYDMRRERDSVLQNNKEIKACAGHIAATPMCSFPNTIMIQEGYKCYIVGVEYKIQTDDLGYEFRFEWLPIKKFFYEENSDKEYCRSCAEELVDLLNYDYEIR